MAPRSRFVAQIMFCFISFFRSCTESFFGSQCVLDQKDEGGREESLGPLNSPFFVLTTESRFVCCSFFVNKKFF